MSPHWRWELKLALLLVLIPTEMLSGISPLYSEFFAKNICKTNNHRFE